jgi:hypothetical protein
MAQCDRHGVQRQVPFEKAHVGVAKAGRADLDLELAVADLWLIDVAEFESVFGIREAPGFHDDSP